MNKVKYTELKILNNQVVELGSMEGDHNQIVFAAESYMKRMDRQKASYCYRVENSEHGISYRYNLTKDEFNQFKKLIPDFK